MAISGCRRSENADDRQRGDGGDDEAVGGAVGGHALAGHCMNRARSER
jgi:hypothetical protein